MNLKIKKDNYHMSINTADIDYSKIIFSKTKHKSATSFLYVYYDKKTLVLKFPKMRLPFGIKKDTISNKCQYISDLSFENSDELLMKIQQLDEFIIDKAHKEIFQDKTLEEVRIMYTSCIKYPSDDRYYPTFRSKIISNEDNTIKCSFYDCEKNEDGKFNKIDVEAEGGESYMMIALQKNTYVESVVECIGLWTRENKFGLSFKTTQLKVYPKVEYIQKQIACAFEDSEDSTSNSEADFLD
jgi:hypothetical protein